MKEKEVRAWGSVLGAVFVGVVLMLSWGVTVQAAGADAYLLLLGGEPERVLASLPLEPEKPFCLEFINSIYLAPVRETFVYQQSRGLSLTKVESPSAGVFEYYGLIPDEAGMVMVQRPLGEIRLLSHDYENHRLTIGDRTLRLKGLIADGEPLILRVWTIERQNP